MNERKPMTENLPDTNVGNIEYIRKQDAVDALGEEYAPRTDFERGMVSQMSCDKGKIKALPSVDVVPVVRCKDCKHHSFDAGYGNYWCNLTSGVRKVKRFDFCSYGERRGE